MLEQTDVKQERAGLPVQMNTTEGTTPHKFFIACRAAEMGCRRGDSEEASADWLYNKNCSLKPGSVFMVFLMPFDDGDEHKTSGPHQLLESVVMVLPVF